MPTPHFCHQCAHFSPLSGTSQGLCRRYPPTSSIIMLPQKHPISHQQTLQPAPICSRPVVEQNDLCGEFTPSSSVLLS